MTTNGQVETALRKVLVVDDEPHILTTIEDLLEEDFTVLAVTDAQLALRLLEKEEVAVILSDQRMPGLSGDQFLHEAQKRSRATRVLITGYADLQALVRAVNEGKIYGYVPKPWEPEELRTLVSKAAHYFALAQDLEHERSLLHTLMDNIPDHVYFKDAASRFTLINKAKASAMGLSDPQTAVGKTDAAFLPVQTALRFFESERDIVESGRPLVDQVEEVREADGRLHWYSTTKVPVKNWEQKVVGIVGISRDVTQRRQAEEVITINLALQQARNQILEMRSETDWQPLVEVVLAQLRTLVPFYACGVNLIDWQAGTLTAHSPDLKGTRFPLPPGLAAVFRQAREKGGYVYRRTQAEMRQCGDAPELLALQIHSVLDVFFSGGTLAVNSTEENAFSARDVQVLERFAQVLSEAHQRLGDLKSLETAEAQLRQAQKLEALGRLAGGVAHDFNNLLTIIDGYSALQLRRLNPDQPQYESLLEIQKAADRGAGLVRQLLAFGRKQSSSPQPLDPNQVVSGVQKMLGRLIGEDVELRVQLAPEAGTVEADPGQLEQVLMNLVVNARDAMPRGGHLTIETALCQLDAAKATSLGLEPGTQYCRLSVHDTGVGMSAEVQQHIFEPFFTTKEAGKGTGLGLATVYGIVKAHRGGIQVHSQEGQGTRFEIYLPCKAAAEMAPDPRQTQPVPSPGGETILLVEDDPNLRPLIARMLREPGYTVLEADRGDTALQTCSSHPQAIALLLTDVVLPGMNGDALAAQATSLHPGMKVLFMSGYTERDGLPLGKGAHFLPKPFTSEHLARAVRQALDSAPPD